MDNQARFTQYLNGIGVGAPARQMLASQAGVNSLRSFLEISTVEFTEVWENLNKGAQSMRMTVEADRPIFTFPAKIRLQAFRLYLEHLVSARATIVTTFDDFDDDEYEIWREHAKTMQLHKDLDKDAFTSVPKITTLQKDWKLFRELLKNRLKQERNATLGVPLLYLIREQGTVTQDDLRADYPSVDDLLVRCTEVRGAMFKRDNRWLYQFLKGRTLGGDAAAFIEPHDRTQDGRAAYMALKDQTEGPTAQLSRCQDAYRTLQNAKYTGKARNFSFAKYVKLHQEAHNILDDDNNDEYLTQDKRIEDFLNGISDPRLSQAVALVRSDRARGAGYDEFYEVQQWLQSELNRIVKTKLSSDEQFRISKLQTDPHQYDGGQGGRGRLGGGGGDDHKRKRSKSQQRKEALKEERKKLKKMTPAQKKAYFDEQRAERKRKAAARAAIGAVTSDTTPEKNPEVPATPKAIAEAAVEIGTRFGATEGTMTINGQQVSFKIGSIQTEEKKSATPDKGSQEEYERLRAESASAQFGRAGRKTMKEMDSLDSPIPKKGNTEDTTTPELPSVPLATPKGTTNISAVSTDRTSSAKKKKRLVPVLVEQTSRLGINALKYDVSENSYGDKVVMVPEKDVPTVRSPDKWFKSLCDTLEAKAKIFQFAERYKGRDVNQLKDTVQRMQVLGIRRRALLEERDYPSDGDGNTQGLSLADQKELAYNNEYMKQLTRQAATGDIPATARLLTFKAAMVETSTDKLRRIYDDALLKVTEALNKLDTGDDADDTGDESEQDDDDEYLDMEDENEASFPSIGA